MQADSFRNRTAIVTGGARGIGLACAEKIAAGGGRVALWDRDMVRARQSAASLKCAIAVEVDVADEASIAKALAATEAELAPPDILIASAGITGPNATVASYPVDAWKQVIDINLTGVFLCNRAVAGGMTQRGDAQVVAVDIKGQARCAAFVIPDHDAPPTETALIAHVRDRLASYKVPARIFFIDEFPVTESANGVKIQRAKLRAMAMETIAAEARSS